MRFREFESRISALPTFNLNDVRKLDPGFHRQQLNYWHNQGYIKPLAGGYYVLADRLMDEMVLFTVANKIYEPSYVSLESALSYYGVIPETVLGVTSVSSCKTKQYESAWGGFSYQSVKPQLMIGYQVIGDIPGNKFKGGGAQIPGVGMTVAPNATSTQKLSPWEPGSAPAGQAPASEPPAGRGGGQAGRGGLGFGMPVGADAPRVILRFPSNPDEMLLSGVLVGGQGQANRAQVVDAPIGTGHVVMFAIRPYWRWQTQGTFFLGINAIMNWNDLNAGR